MEKLNVLDEHLSRKFVIRKIAVDLFNKEISTYAVIGPIENYYKFL